jgi:micrococcal nuclease
MRKLKKFLLGIAITGLLATQASAKTMYGNVLSVYDGDTLTVSFCNVLDLKVRLIGVDTPEVRGGTELTKNAGKEIRDKLRDMLVGKEVRIITDKKQRPYGRVLGYVYIGNTMVNQWLIEQGYAVPLFYQPNIKYQQEFEYLSEIAEESKAGFWGTGVFDKTPKQIRSEAQDDI